MAKCVDCIDKYEKSKQRKRAAKKRQKKKEELTRPVIRQTVLPQQQRIPTGENLTDLVKALILQQSLQKPTLQRSTNVQTSAPRKRTEQLTNTLERPRTVNEATMNAVNVLNPFIDYTSALFSAAPLIPGAIAAPITHAWGMVSPAATGLASGATSLTRGLASGASGLASGASGLATGASGLATGSVNYLVDVLARAAPPLSDLDEPDFFRPLAPPASVVDDLAARRLVQNTPVERIFLTEVPEPLIPETETPLPEHTILDLMTRTSVSPLVPNPLDLYPEGEDVFMDVMNEEPNADEEPIVVQGEEYTSPELPLEEEPQKIETSASLVSGEGENQEPQTAATLVRVRTEAQLEGDRKKTEAAQRKREERDALVSKYGEEMLTLGFVKRDGKPDVKRYMKEREAANLAGFIKNNEPDVTGYMDRQATDYDKLAAAAAAADVSQFL